MNKDEFELFKKHTEHMKEPHIPEYYKRLNDKFAILVFDIGILREFMKKEHIFNEKYFNIELSASFASTLLASCESLDEAFNLLRQIERGMQLVDKEVYGKK